MADPAIEHAIFTSVRGPTMEGYQVAATSPGVTAQEAKELAVWGPAHGSLLDPRPGAESINFHRLESGKFCVSLTTALSAEYSGRGGCQVYTQNLLVAAETLARFANDPFRLLEAAQAAGRLEPDAKVPPRLEAFALSGGAASVNGALVARMARDPGPALTARLVEAALRHRIIAVAADVPLRQLFAGFLNLLPVECRPEFSLTTGLRHAARRPFRLAPLPHDTEERLRTTTGGVAIAVELNANASASTPTTGWAGLVHRMLRDQPATPLLTALREPRPGLTCRDLAGLAESLAASARLPLAAKS